MLSFRYDPVTDTYDPIRVWQNPDDDDDFVAASALASRHSREKLFNEMADNCEIVVGEMPPGSA